MYPDLAQSSEQQSQGSNKRGTKHWCLSLSGETEKDQEAELCSRVIRREGKTHLWFKTWVNGLEYAENIGLGPSIAESSRQLRGAMNRP